MNVKFHKWMFTAGTLAAMPSFAGGFEKVIMWSGKYTGIAGAASSSVEGSQSLFFNPAGLANGESEKKWEVSANLSPTFPQFKGPVIKADDNRKSSRPLVNVGGLTASYRATPQLGLGVGLFASGGSKNTYSVDVKDVAPAQTAFGPVDVGTDLKIMEASLGAAYKIIPNWTVGASWRASFVQANFSTFQPTPVSTTAAITWLNLHDLKQTKWDGFRLGTQYRAASNDWGVGASFRSNVNFKAKGKANGKAGSPAGGGVTELADGDASAKSSLPWGLSAGGDYALTPKLRLFAEYTWIRYSKDKALGIEGNVTANGAASPINQDLELGFHDLHSVRIATECTHFENWAIRTGYIFTSPVANQAYARATLVAPGTGHSFLLGTGTSFMDKTLDVDATAEYSFAGKKVEAGKGLAGNYRTDAYALHLGTTYRF